MISIMTVSSDCPNLLSIGKVRTRKNDWGGKGSYAPAMPRKRNPSPPSGADWYLSEWMNTLHVNQATLGRETGWSKATVHDIYHGITGYYRKIVNEAALALNIHPFELLMPPAEAMALRRLRDSALTIAAEERVVFTPAEAPGTRLLPRKTG